MLTNNLGNNTLGRPEPGHDRILVLVGAGHLPLLRQFIMDSPDLLYVDPLPYLD